MAHWPPLGYGCVPIARLAAESHLSMSERPHRPGEPPLSPPPPHPNAGVPLMNDAARVWLSSEFVDPFAYFRFDPPVAVYEGAGWPLGARPGHDKEEQVDLSGMRDGCFDWD